MKLRSSLLKNYCLVTYPILTNDGAEKLPFAATGLQEITRRIVAAAKPVKVILFGSWAREMAPYSTGLTHTRFIYSP
jgi:hypothetical protein